MFWFANDGGPLLVAPRSALGSWEGGDPPSAGRVVAVQWQYDPARPATDYDRACAVTPPVGVVEIGNDWGVVLTADGSATWLEVNVLAIALLAEDSGRDTLLNFLNALPNAAWSLVIPSASVDRDGVLLLHAASTLKDVEIRTASEAGNAHIGDAILSPIPAGRYRLEYARQSTGARSEVSFLRFRPLESVAA